MTSMFSFFFPLYTAESGYKGAGGGTEKKGESVEDEARRQGRSFDETFTASLCKQLHKLL